MAKTKTTTSPSGTDRDSFTKDKLTEISRLMDDVLRAREKLRTKTGALKEAQQQLYSGLAEGLQLKMKFGPQHEEEDDEEDDEPESLSAEG